MTMTHPDPSEIAKVLIVWFEGFGYLHDNLLPSTATWDEFSPKEQLRALKAANAVVDALRTSDAAEIKKLTDDLKEDIRAVIESRYEPNDAIQVKTWPREVAPPNIESILHKFAQAATACANLVNAETVVTRLIDGNRIVSLEARDFRELARWIDEVKAAQKPERVAP